MYPTKNSLCKNCKIFFIEFMCENVCCKSYGSSTIIISLYNDNIEQKFVLFIVKEFEQNGLE